MQKAKKIVIALIVVVLVVISSFLVWRALAAATPRHVAVAYINALAAGDAETALQYSSGGAAFAASRMKGSKVTAKVDSTFYSVEALGRGWARALTTVELTLQDGSADVGWYSMDVVKSEQGWKVVSFREAEPELSGVSLLVKQADTEAARQVFQGYLDALAAGDWRGATECLVGPARRSQEMGAAVLGKGAVIGKVEELKAEPVWKRGKEMVVRFCYVVDGRDVSVITMFFKTTQGWKITKIVQD